MTNKFIYVLLFSLLFIQGLKADKVDTIYEKELIHVGVRYEHKPLAFINKKGKIDGFEIDLVKFIADKLNVRVKFHQVNSINRSSYLINGKLDFVIASMDIKNTKDLAYSNKYFAEKTVFLVQKSNNIEDIEEIQNKIVAVIKGEKTDSYLLETLKNARVVYFREYPQASRSLDKNNVTAILANESWAKQINIKSLNKFDIIETDLYDLSYVIGVKKGETRLLELLNSALGSCVKEGVYEETYLKWFNKEAIFLPKK